MQPSTTCLYIYIYIYNIYIYIYHYLNLHSPTRFDPPRPSQWVAHPSAHAPTSLAVHPRSHDQLQWRPLKFWGHHIDVLPDGGLKNNPQKKHCNGSCGNIRMVMDGSVLGLPHYADGNAWTFETCWNQKHHTGVKGLGKGATEQQSPVLVVVPRKRNKFARANLPQGSVSRNFALKSRS